MARKRKQKQKSTVVGMAGPNQPENNDSETTGVRTWLLPLAGVSLILVAGVVHGLQSQRWVSSTEIQTAADRLNDVPLKIGKWEGEVLEIPQAQLDIAGASGSLYRNYKSTDSGEVVQVMVVCGPHGPISVHPPTVCFTGAGWVVKALDETDVSNEGGDQSLGRFRVALFEKSLPQGAVRMRTYWAWSSQETWSAPENPRFEFAGSRYLYKIYVSTLIPSRQGLQPQNDGKNPDADNADRCVEFMREFLPELAKHSVGSL